MVILKKGTLQGGAELYNLKKLSLAGLHELIALPRYAYENLVFRHHGQGFPHRGPAYFVFVD